MQPDPDVAQDQRHGDEEKPHHRIARAGLDAGLVQLPVARFDAEAAAVGVFDPAGCARLDAPVGVDPSLASGFVRSWSV